MLKMCQLQQRHMTHTYFDLLQSAFAAMVDKQHELSNFTLDAKEWGVINEEDDFFTIEEGHHS